MLWADSPWYRGCGTCVQLCDNLGFEKAEQDSSCSVVKFALQTAQNKEIDFVM